MIRRAAAFAAVTAILVAWNIATAGRAVRSPNPSRALSVVSGLAGFLIAPALVVHAGAQSALTGRLLTPLSWMGPLVFALCTVQVAMAWWRRAAAPLVAVPLLALNVLQCLIATASVAGARWPVVPELLMLPVMAQAGLFARVFGPAAYASPLAIIVPVLAPTVPARSRATRTVRALLAAGAASAAALVAVAMPPAARDLATYRGFGEGRLTERGRGSFSTGLSILPELRGLPRAASLRDDLALADSLDVGALYVRVAPEGTTAAALDSLGRALDARRRDSTQLLVAIEAGARHSLVTAELVMHHLHPDFLVLAGTRDRGGLATVAALAHRLRPAARVAVQLSAANEADSLLFQWATGIGSPVDAIVFSVRAADGGAQRVRSELSAAERWMRNEDGAREHWLLAVAAPLAQGEDAQQRVLLHALGWAAERTLVRGVVLGEAADYAQGTGLRTVDGRLRRAAGEVAAAIRTIDETTSPRVR